MERDARIIFYIVERLKRTDELTRAQNAKARPANEQRLRIAPYINRTFSQIRLAPRKKPRNICKSRKCAGSTIRVFYERENGVQEAPEISRQTSGLVRKAGGRGRTFDLISKSNFLSGTTSYIRRFRVKRRTKCSLDVVWFFSTRSVGESSN